MNGSLLIVDDDADQLSTLASWFGRRGYEVVTAKHPQQALVAASRRRFQAALIDASLPDIDGLELMKRLKRLQNHLPVIILSGYDFSAFRTSESWSNADGAFACLTKPCELGLLEKTIGQAIDCAVDEPPPMEQFGDGPFCEVAVATK